jgi:hypothetical protein
VYFGNPETHRPVISDAVRQDLTSSKRDFPAITVPVVMNDLDIKLIENVSQTASEIRRDSFQEQFG